MRVRAHLLRIGRALRRVIGAPDYDRYLAELARVAPDARPLTHQAFVRDALARRYDRPGARCC